MFTTVLHVHGSDSSSPSRQVNTVGLYPKSTDEYGPLRREACLRLQTTETLALDRVKLIVGCMQSPFIARDLGDDMFTFH